MHNFLFSFNDIADDRMIYRGRNKYLFWHISLVDNVHHIVSDMTDEQPYNWSVGGCFESDAIFMAHVLNAS